MLKLNITKEEYDALNDALKSEYKEADDGYMIQVEGIKTQADIDAIKKAKDQAKREQKEAQDKLKELERERDSLLDKVNAYESDKDLKLSKEQLVEFERLKRENEALTKDKTELEKNFNGLQTEITTSKIKAELAKHAKGIMEESAINDQIDILCNKFVFSEGKVLTNTDLGDKSGLEAKEYLSKYVEERPYLQPKSSGGGAGGSQGSGGGSQTNHNISGVAEISASQELWGEKK